MRLITGTTLAVALVAATMVGLAPPAAAAGSGTIAVQLAAPDGTAIRLANVELAAIGTDAVVGNATTDVDGTATFTGIPAPDTEGRARSRDAGTTRAP